MNPHEVRSYIERWRRVNDRERDELRSTPPERKFTQLAALMASALALGWTTSSSVEVESVRHRWNRLREVLRA